MNPLTGAAGADPSRRAAPTRDGTGWLLAAWTLVVVGDSLNRGDFEVSALVCIGCGLALAFAVAVRRLPITVPGRGQLVVPVGACLVAGVAHPVAASMQMSGSRLVAVQAVAAATAATAVAGLLAYPQRQRAALLLTAAGTVALAGLVFGFVPHPGIDVWAILQQSSSGLLHGADAYRQHWIDGYGLKTVYPYLPWSTVLVTPFYVVFGDVRVAMLVSLLLAAWLLRRMAPHAPAALASLILVTPHLAYYLLRSWTEPTLTVLLFAALLLLARGRATWAMLALAVALACKQPVALLLPLFALWPSFGVRRAAGAVAIGLALVSPWLVAGPSAFWHDAVSANLGLGPIPRALSIPSALARDGIHVGFVLLAIVVLAAYAVAWRWLPRTPAGLALGCALVGCGYALANTQSFFNHYQLPAALLLAAVALPGVGGAGYAADRRRGSTGASRPVPRAASEVSGSPRSSW